MSSELQVIAGGGDTGADQPARNEGMPLDLSWLRDARVNRSAVERRAATLGTRRTVKKDWQAAWLLKAVSCIDLTTLSGDDTPGRVHRLCVKARRPLRQDILEALGAERLDVTVGAVCVYHNMIEPAVEALMGSGIPVAAVSAGFPAGLGPLETRIREIEVSVAAGAREPLATVLAEHDEVNALWYVGPAAGCAEIERGSTGNLKQTWTNHGKARNWFDPVQGEGPEFLWHAKQVKNIWVLYGE